MAKRTYENLIGFVQAVSPQKDDGSFRFTFQCDGETVKKSICFDKQKRNQFEKYQLSGDAMKLKNVAIQVPKKKQFAELIVNHMSVIESASATDVTFSKLPVDIVFKTIKDIRETCAVEDLMNVRGKFSMENCKIEEKIVRNEKKNMMEHCVLMDNTGFIYVTLWEQFIPQLEQAMTDGPAFIEFQGLRVKIFNKQIYLTSTSNDTMFGKADAIDLGDMEKQYEIAKGDDAPPSGTIEISHFEAVSNYSKFYLCTNCQRKLVETIDTLSGKKVECIVCGARQRLDRLQKGITVNAKIHGCNSQLQLSSSVIAKGLKVCFGNEIDIFQLSSEQLMDILLDIEHVIVQVDYINNIIQDIKKVNVQAANNSAQTSKTSEQC